MVSSEQIIEHTKKWINDGVIGCNFCPFAAKVVRQNAVYYTVTFKSTSTDVELPIQEELIRLDRNKNIETSFLIFPDTFSDFNEYPGLVADVDKLIIENGYEGITS